MGGTVAIVLLVVIGTITMFNLLFSLAFARRLRELAAQQLKSNVNGMLPEIGRHVRPFDVIALDGSAITSDDASRSIVALFVSTTCPACDRLQKKLGNDRFPEETLVFVHGHEESGVPEFARSFDEVATHVAWLGEDNTVRDAFGVEAYPTLLRVVGGVVTEAALNLKDFTVKPQMAVSAGHNV